MDTDGPIPLTSDGAAVTGDISELVLLFLVLVALGAFFGGAESAFSAVNKVRIKAKADSGDTHAKNALFITSNFDRALTALLIGNNITHIGAASVATLIAARLFGTSDRVTVICTIVTTFVVFLFSEMIPKSFANDRPETTALLSSGILRGIMKVFTPLTLFFSWIAGGFSWLFCRLFHTQNAPSITEEELYDIIETIEEEGVVNEEQGDLMKSAMDFSGTCAKDVMTVRRDIDGIDDTLPSREILRLLREVNHTRLPVYHGDIDHIAGILHIRQFFSEYQRNPDVDIHDLLLPALRVPPQAKIDDLLTEMRRRKFYLAVVTGERGETLGLVTIEDFLEELVGEIWDEEDVVDRNFVKLGGNRYQVSTHMTLSELSQRLGIASPNPQENNLPLLSLMLQYLGHVPKEDDTFSIGCLTFTAEEPDTDGHADSVLIHLTDNDASTFSADTEVKA